MSCIESEIEELKRSCEGVARAEEGGCVYFFLKGLALPEGCIPCTCDALLCPGGRDGYPSRLFFAEEVQGAYGRNWNGGVRVLERNWQAFSWKVSANGLRLAELVARHLEGFTRAE